MNKEKAMKLYTCPKCGKTFPIVAPKAWMLWTNGPVRVFMNKQDAEVELQRLNSIYPNEAKDRKIIELIGENQVKEI